MEEPQSMRLLYVELENAVEAMSQVRRIHIHTFILDNTVVFKICDAGVGMSDEDMRRAS